ncbi:hypothetical protein BDN70DRAFT_895349 [Pholiota conissans]|uniref:Fungal-type protein kinase domain-containing protein n=1 Tax=Pholiota conissans TaxID=109636 RepID=A0A9P5Z304_9AGAR|nr:hypothetical protein BDN70DRAFT_895349 [Pholiota conissans]
MFNVFSRKRSFLFGRTPWRTWHPSSVNFAGDSFGPETETGGVVSRDEYDSVHYNIETAGYHKWMLRNAPNGEKWIPSTEMDAELESMLAQCGDFYDDTKQQWDLGTNLEGLGLVRGYRRLLDKLLPLCAPQGCSDMFVASRCLSDVRNPAHFFKSAPLIALCRNPNSTISNTEGGYHNLVAPVEIVSERSVADFGKVRDQLGIYARRCMMHRPQLQSVNCLFFAKDALYVYVFDRNGYHVTMSIRIHEQPKEFLFALYCVSQSEYSPDTIFWENGIQRLLITDAESSTQCLFDVECILHVSPSICGPSTACWAVRSTNTKELLYFKRTFVHATSRDESEGKILNNIHGIEGLTELVAYTDDLIGYKFDDDPYECTDIDESPLSQYSKLLKHSRRHRSVITEYLARDISECSTELGLLYILRDAVRAHKELWELGMCHRDISVGNIRIRESPYLGWKGVLAGLDKAKPISQVATIVPCLPDCSEKIFFQSMHILRVMSTDTTDKGVFPNYWDDLESFFYVLCYICGKDRSMFRCWVIESDNTALESKMELFSRRIAPSFVKHQYGLVFSQLLEKMRSCLQEHESEWAEFWIDIGILPPPNPLDLKGYELFIAMIDDAIANS